MGNLGDLLSQQNRTEEAKDHLQQAIALCDETMPPGAGVFRGSLALIYAKEQRYEEAFALLKQGAASFTMAVGSSAQDLQKGLQKQGRSQEGQAPHSTALALKYSLGR